MTLDDLIANLQKVKNDLDAQGYKNSEVFIDHPNWIERMEIEDVSVRDGLKFLGKYKLVIMHVI